MRRLAFVCVTTVFALQAGSVTATAEPADDAVACLLALQNSNGSWGDPGGSGYPDSTAAIDGLIKAGEDGSAVTDGVSFVQAVPAQNQDYLSRRISTVYGSGGTDPLSVDELLGGQQLPTAVLSEFNFPQGGWGAAPGLGSETLTTALAVRGLVAAGLSEGLSVVLAVVVSGNDNTHEFYLPAGASDLSVSVRDVTGSIQLSVTLPSGGSGSLNVSSPVNFVGIPAEEGTYSIRIASLMGSPNVYSLEARFMDASGFDVSLVTRAVSYIGYGQNPDGSWGYARGNDGSLSATAEVVRTLAAVGDAFEPPDALTAAANWLGTLQNPDGGFGSAPGMSTPYETALAALAMVAVDPTATAVDDAKNYLTSTQQASGCWDDDPYATGLALQLLAGVSCVLDVDANGSVAVATDVVYIARRLLNPNLLPVPPSFRLLDPTIPPDAEIAARIDAAGLAFDVDGNGSVAVATDIVYIARRLLNPNLLPVPPSFRLLDPTIPPDAEIAATIDALCP